MKSIHFREMGRKVLRGSENAGKVGIAAILAAVGFELTFLGLKMVKSDAKFIGNTAKYCISPDVYKVKKRGLFHRTKNVNINPITGKMKLDETGKKPVNKKVFKY